jgi:hypothetical protein
MAQVPDEWWDNNLDAVEEFRKFISSAMIIHINNILRCRADPHLSNIPALNEVKSLDHITRHIRIPHIHSTNFANEINLSHENTSKMGFRIRGRGRGRGRFGRGIGRNYH